MWDSLAASGSSTRQWSSCGRSSRAPARGAGRPHQSAPGDRAPAGRGAGGAPARAGAPRRALGARARPSPSSTEAAPTSAERRRPSPGRAARRHRRERAVLRPRRRRARLRGRRRAHQRAARHRARRRAAAHDRRLRGAGPARLGTARGGDAAAAVGASSPRARCSRSAGAAGRTASPSASRAWPRVGAGARRVRRRHRGGLDLRTGRAAGPAARAPRSSARCSTRPPRSRAPPADRPSAASEPGRPLVVPGDVRPRVDDDGPQA